MAISSTFTMIHLNPKPFFLIILGPILRHIYHLTNILFISEKK